MVLLYSPGWTGVNTLVYGGARLFCLWGLKMVQMEASRLERNDWVLAAVDVLKQEGVDRVKVDPLAKKLGVTRGSFYWHFGKRQDLLDAILCHWKDMSTQSVIVEVERENDTPEGRLRHLIDFALSVDEDRISLELAIRAWARTDIAVKAALFEIDEQRISYLKQLILDIGWRESDAHQHASYIYYCRTGLYNQAVVPDLETRQGMTDYLMKMVAR